MKNKIATSFQQFLNEKIVISKTYDEFVSSLLPIDKFLKKLKIKVSKSSYISYSFSLTIDGYEFASYVPCLKYDTEEYVLNNTILPRKEYWYGQYIEESFNDFINGNKITEGDNISINDRVYVIKNKPLNPMGFTSFNYKLNSVNHTNLKNLRLYDSININSYNTLFRVK